MNTFESVSVALTSIWSRRLRSFLTLLGVIIGVATVIAVVSIIEGMNNYVVGTLSSFGVDSFTISRLGIITSRQDFLDARRRERIRMDQMISLRKNCTACGEVGATISGSARVKHGRDTVDDVELIGATANIMEIGDYHLAEGRSFFSSDENHKRAVCVIGSEVADVLFPEQDPVDKEIKIGRHRFTVIGVNEKRGSFLGQNLDNFAIIPVSLYQKIYGTNSSVEIHVKARERDRLESTKDQAVFLFRMIRGLGRDDEDDFGVVTTNALLDAYRNFTGMAYVVMIGVSSISLLIGGIVIMNIMLVAVTERIKEIGIRKAIGARRIDILGQFLAESATIAIVGGIVGILVGGGVARIVSHYSPLPSSIEPWAVIAGMLVSGSVGIGSGVVPALKAARMDPIQALRQE